ncbi:MAG: TolC family protein [Prevotella sp.]|nr:TolC family protein [Prevotella sp.]MDY4040445.1 TolC family protein [Prevotella sp.]
MGKRLPAVGVGAGYTYTDMLRSRNNFGMVFATVSIPISDWWGGSHAVRRRQIAARNAREQLEDNMQLLKINMLKNWNDVDDAYKQLALAKKGIEQSEENLRLNRDFYHAGTVKMSDLLDAQRLFQQTRDQYVDAFAQLQIKMLEYRQSIGQ